jgi:hypothetical protein
MLMGEEMDLQQLRAKFRGALLGVAMGAALGAPFEGAGAIHSPTPRLSILC